MKKIKFLILVSLVMLVSACSLKKEPLDDEEFIRIMTSMDFTVEDQEKYLIENEFVEDYLVAIQEDNNYQIAFVELDSNKYAKKGYENAKKFLKYMESEAINVNEENLINNSKYVVTTEDMYFVISRIEDTIIFIIEADIEYKNEVNKILKKLGY